MADVYFQTANTNPALPFGNVPAGGGAGTEASPYTALGQIATSLAAGDNCILHPACYWAGSTLSLSSAAPAGGATLSRWDIPGYEGWFPTLDMSIFPSSWTSIGSGRWTYTLVGVTITGSNADVIAIGGHTAGDCRGVEFRSSITRNRQYSPIASANRAGDFLPTTSGSDTLFTVYTGSDAVNPDAMFGGYVFCIRNGAYSRALFMAGAKRLTLEDFQIIGGGYSSQPGAGVTSEDMMLRRLRQFGTSYMGMEVNPTSATGLVQNWVIDMPYFDSGSALDLPQVGVNASMGTNNGISITRRCQNIQVRDPKIHGFSHGGIQSLTVVGDAALVDDDFSWPKNISIVKTREDAGYNEIICGRGYRRGISMCGGDWIVDRLVIKEQSAQSQFSGTGVMVMPQWRGGTQTEASATNYGSASGFALQQETGGMQPQRIIVLNAILDEVPNMPVSMPGSTTIADGALQIYNAVVNSLTTYSPKYVPNENSNVLWPDIAPFSGGRIYTGGEAVGIVPLVKGCLFIIPDTETVIISLQDSGDDGEDPASWGRRYTAAQEDSYVSGNVAVNSLVAANLNDDLEWTGTPKPAIPNWVA